MPQMTTTNMKVFIFFSPPRMLPLCNHCCNVLVSAGVRLCAVQPLAYQKVLLGFHSGMELGSRFFPQWEQWNVLCLKPSNHGRLTSP